MNNNDGNNSSDDEFSSTDDEELSNLNISQIVAASLQEEYSCRVYKNYLDLDHEGQHDPTSNVSGSGNIPATASSLRASAISILSNHAAVGSTLDGVGPVDAYSGLGESSAASKKVCIVLFRLLLKNYYML